MKKCTLQTLAIASLVSLFSACLYQNIRASGPENYHTQYQLTTRDFEIVGTVEQEGTYKSWFWVAASGGSTYSDMLEKARALGGDDIINYNYDLNIKMIVLWLYYRVNYKATATVVKFKPDVLRNGKFLRAEALIKTPTSDPDQKEIEKKPVDKEDPSIKKVEEKVE